MQINVSYITANDIMEILGVGRSKAYEIVRVMNEELENAGYNIIKGKVPVRYFLSWGIPEQRINQDSEKENHKTLQLVVK